MRDVHVFAEITTLFLILWVAVWWFPVHWQRCQMFSDSHIETFACLIR